MSELDTKSELSLEDKVRALTDAQFYWARLQSNNPTSFEEAILKFKNSYIGMSALELDELIRREYEVKEIKDRHRTLDETDIKLNFINFNPDLKHWARMNYWTRAQAINLAHGKEPFLINLDHYRRLNGSKIIHEMVQLEAIFMTIPSLRIGNHPTEYLEFFEQKEITFPRKLKEYIQKFHPEKFANPSPNDAKSSNSPPIPKEKPLHAKERESLEKLVIGLACTSYTTESVKNGRTKATEIRDDILRNAGIEMDDDTIRKYLNNAMKRLNLDEQK